MIALVQSLAFALSVVAGAPGSATADMGDAPPTIDILTRAEQAYDRGVEALSTDPVASREAFAQAAAAYRSAISSGAAPGAATLNNLGAAAMLSEDLGTAVLSFRRALTLDPSLRGARDNLEAARAKLGVPAVQPLNPVRKALAAASSVPPAAEFWVFAAASGLAFALGTVRLVRWHRTDGRVGSAFPGRGLIALPAAVAVISCTLFLATPMLSMEATDAVVLRTGVAKAGPDEKTYPDAAKEPIKAGSEVRLVQRRASWTMIELRGGQRVWVPSDLVETVGS